MEEAISYIDLGFNQFGLNLPINQSFRSANLNDAFFELSEFSVRNPNLKGDSVSTEKIRNLAVTDAKIQNITVDKLTAGTISVAANIGNGNVKIDGANKRIIINDGANDRVLIGYLSGGF